MAKKWMKFLSDYKAADGAEFKKDAVVQIEEETCTLIKGLKYADFTDAPKLEDQYDKTFEILAKKLDETLDNILTKTVGELSKKWASKSGKEFINITSDDDKSPQGAYAKSFSSDADYFNAVIKSSGNNHKEWDERFTTKAPSGMNTMDDSEGGFLVPDTVVDSIWTNMQENPAAILPRTDQRKTSGNNMKFLRMPEVSRKNGYRHAGITAYWTAEAEPFVSSQPKFGNFQLDLHKITVLVYVTQEQLDDSRVAITPIISRLAADAINFLVNESFIWGTGVGKPKGVMREEALITVSKESAQTNNTIGHKNIARMYSRLHPSYRSGAVWLFHPNVEEQLQYITFKDDATVAPIPIYFPPGSTSLGSSPTTGRLYGLPAMPCEFCSDLGTKGDIILANWKEYITLTKANGGIKFAESMHVRFLYEEMAYRFSFRIGGASPWSAPIEDYNGTTTRSPFITLEDRSATPLSSGL